MRRRGTIAVAVAMLAASLSAATPARAATQSTPTPNATHVGRWFTDATGRVLVLHGMGVMDYSPPSTPAAMGFGDKDASFLAAHGINLVRLGMNWSAIEPAPGVFSLPYLRSITTTVRTLAAHRIYTLLDFHQDDWGTAAAGIDGAPVWATLTDGLPNPALGYGFGMFADPAQWRAFDNFWANAPGPGGVGITNRFAAMLAFYGRAFRDQPYLLGYDIFNEPNAGSLYPTCVSPVGCPVFDRELAHWYENVAPVLRAADPKHLILYEPNVFFDFGANTNLGPPPDPDTGFAWHSYCVGDGAAAALPSIPGNGPGCAIEEELELHDALAYGSRSGAALIADEWGATNDVTTIARQTAEFDGAQMPWVFWDYRNLVHDVARAPVGANVDQVMLAALDRPYPQEVAGTPVSWQWDPAARSFTLEYSTTLVDGRAAGSRRTEIFVPALQFPHGYSASVTGGHVVSSSDPQLLTVVGTGPTVHVVVRPRSSGP